MKSPIPRVLFIFVVLAVLLYGCVPAPVTAPAPVSSPAEPPPAPPEPPTAAPEPPASDPAAPTPMPPPAEPASNKPLSAILKAIEERRLGSIAEAEYDDDLWEVTVCGDGGCQKLYLDPRTGEELRRKAAGPEELPPAGAMPLSTIVQAVEALGLGFIEEVEFEDGVWEFELHKDGGKVKLVADPMTGEVEILRTKP